MTSTTRYPNKLSLWGRFEREFTATEDYANPIQEVSLSVELEAPSGRLQRIDAFWDGGPVWRFRFSPDEMGGWRYRTLCSNASDAGLHDQNGTFEVSGAPRTGTRFEQHGGVKLSADRRYLVHADGTPFLWLGDTAWNGPLRATAEEWAHYLRGRVRQRFTAVQWAATQWLSAPSGDIEGNVAYTGVERIAIQPSFFQRMDQQVEATAAAGLLNVPVLLWAAEWRSPEENQVNPGHSLPDDQAILLARYMVARWGAYPVAWILPGDGDYRGPKADRWKRIGRGIFGDADHAPVSLHPGGKQWNGDEFREESWLDLLGYQSGHGDDEETLTWLVCGPPATDWKTGPARPFINLEPPYEYHIAYHSKSRISAQFARRALYWSLLVSPTAGVTYGGHGVWGWDDGTATPIAHPNTGIPLAWRDALIMECAEQMAYLADLFEQIEWWRLQPAPELLAEQPGDTDKGRFVAASSSPEKDLAVVYIPMDSSIALNLEGMTENLSALWFNPRSGARQAATIEGGRFATPGPGDWVLLLGRSVSLPARQGT